MNLRSDRGSLKINKCFVSIITLVEVHEDVDASNRVVREFSREWNCLRPRPGKILSFNCPQPLHLHQKTKQLHSHSGTDKHDGQERTPPFTNTYASTPCYSCSQVDDEAGLVCEACDKVQHFKCMSNRPREDCPEGDWYCEECRLIPLGKRKPRKPCVACGIMDEDSDEVRCGRCGEGGHAYHWPSSSTAHTFFCSNLCRHAADEDTRLLDRSNTLWDGIDGNVVKTVDEMNGDLSSDSAARFLSSTEPSVFAVCIDGPRDLCYALYVPLQFSGTAFEVVQASATEPFDACTPLLAPRHVYLLTGKSFDVPRASAFCKTIQPLPAHIGQTDGWVVPTGYSALVPMSIDLDKCETSSLPDHLARHFSSVCHQRHDFADESVCSDYLNVVELYCGLGCFIDGAVRGGYLGWGAGVESNPEVAEAFASYSRGNGNIDTYVAKVESILGLPGHVVEPGGDAQRLLDALKKRPVDVLAGSPLCEGFSSLNAHSTSKAAMLKRNHMKYWGQAVMKFKPEYAVMENVPEIMSPKYKEHISTLLLQLAGCGYQLQCYVLSNWAFGAASDRERFVLLATRLGTPLPPSLQPFHAKMDVDQNKTGVRWAFASRRAQVGESSRGNSELPRCPTLAHVFNTLGSPKVPPRKANVVGDLHAARIETRRVQSLMDGLPTGINACYATIPQSIRNVHGVERFEENLTAIGNRVYLRQRLDRPARSPTKKSSPEGMQGCAMHPTESRVCTPAENLCAMGYAHERLPEAKLSVGHVMAGNGFSPLVTKAIFNVIGVSRRRRKRKREDDASGHHRDGLGHERPWDKEVMRRLRLLRKEQ